MSKPAARPLAGAIPPPATDDGPTPQRCESCGYGNVELFGYRDRDSGSWRWFCAAHRLGRWYADARRWPAPIQEDDDECC